MIRFGSRWAGISLLCVVAALASGPVSAAGQNSAGADALVSFSGRALTVPSNLVPGAQLTVDQATSGSGSYQVAYRGGQGRVVIQGNKGRGSYSSGVQKTRGCSATYCATAARSAGGATSEVFRNLTVHGDPAILEHTVGGPDASWTLVWYDTHSDVSYSLTLSESLGGKFLAGGTDPTNVSMSSTVSSLAEKLAAPDPRTANP